MQNKSWFTAPTGTRDRFHKEDIPTEVNFRELFNSIPFFKDVPDRAQLTQAGIAKTSKDKHINLRQNFDYAGASPVGFTTFVRPSQIPKHTSGTGIVVTPTLRVLGDDQNSDAGTGVQDYVYSLDPAYLFQGSNGLPLSTEVADDLTVQVVGQSPDIFNINLTPATTDNTQSTFAALSMLTDAINALATNYQASQNIYGEERLRIGEIVLTVIPPATWSPRFLEPLGQTVSQATYAELFALVGTAYNTGGEPVGTFRLPNFKDKFPQIVQSTAFVATGTGGAADYTLAVGNIPQHAHSAGTLATTSAGSHSHSVDFAVIQSTIAAAGVIPLASDDATPIGAIPTITTSSAGAHTHAITGSTGNYGTLSPTPIDTIPPFFGFYCKFKVL